LTNLNIVVNGGATISCDNCNTPIVTINGSGTLSISADVPDSLGCGAFATIPYGIGPVEMITDRVFLCPNVPTVVDLSVYGFENPEITANDGSANCNGASYCDMPVVTISESGGAITISADNSNMGFCMSETTIQFTPFGQDGGTIVAIDSLPYAQGETITVELQPPGPAGATYQWFLNGVLQNDTGPSAMITFSDAGPANVSVIWTNSSGCEETASVDYLIDPADVKFPNAFTPNGDGDNELFRPRITGVGVLDNLLVFNRWGQLVYEGSDPDGWDGKFNGEDVPPEVYVYLGTVRFPNGDTQEYKGDVTLIR
jgi:gliding motility-associated-like protein